MKIDLHVHTLPNRYLDYNFSFNKNFLQTYVKSNNFEVIAITNHNFFDEDNYNECFDALKDTSCLVLPGIEVSLNKGHILVIGNNDSLSKNNLKTISNHIKLSECDDQYSMSISDFNSLVCGKNFLLIPHYDKKPKIDDETIEKIQDDIFCGEMHSQKKFLACKKEEIILTPVVFSDIRIGFKTDENDYTNKSRCTYLNISEKSFDCLANGLKDRNLVSVCSDFSTENFDILNGKAHASTGINVLIGKRSSGKTFTLNHIEEDSDSSVLYIKQFEIADKCDDEDFKTLLEKITKNNVKQKFVELIPVFNYLDSEEPNLKIMGLKTYANSLIEASNNSYQDIYSQCGLFNTSLIQAEDTEQVKKLIKSVENLIEAQSEYKNLISQYIDIEDLKKLYLELVLRNKNITLKNNNITKANAISTKISELLGDKTISVSINKIDFVALSKSIYIKKKFDYLINNFDLNKLKEEENIVGKFKKVIEVKRITGIRDFKNSIGIKASIQVPELEKKLNQPFELYFSVLNDPNVNNISGNNRFSMFFKGESSVKNDLNKDLSGGQRAEFILLEKLNQYQRYDVILIDEMESSFDNPFLNKEIIEKIREISKVATVFISTHNNNLGVSLAPDFYIYHEVDNTGTEPIFKHYCGSAVSKDLVDEFGNKIPTSKALTLTMEANEKAYKGRALKYEIDQN